MGDCVDNVRLVSGFTKIWDLKHTELPAVRVTSCAAKREMLILVEGHGSTVLR